MLTSVIRVCSPHPELYGIDDEKGRNTLTFLYGKGRRAKKPKVRRKTLITLVSKDAIAIGGIGFSQSDQLYSGFVSANLAFGS